MRTATIAALAALAVLAPPRLAAAQDRPRALLERTVANQHGDDAGLLQYERLEQRIEYAGGSIVSDRTYRLVPTGTGRLSLLVRNGDQTVGLEFYQDELRSWQSVLNHAVDPNDPRERRSEGQLREQQERRAKLIDAIGRAFRVTWLGEQVSNGRTLAHLRFEPDPSYRPTSRWTDMLRHVSADVWVDEQAAQLVRADVEIISDISFGDGIASKVYGGSRILIEKSEVAPGIWLPIREEYWLRFRRFFLTSNEHKVLITTNYRFIGTPRDAILEVHNELASGRGFSLDP